MTRRPVDHILRDWLAAQVPDVELRDVIRDEFAGIYMYLPAPGASPSHFVHELFIAARSRGVLAELRACLRRHWPAAPVRAARPTKVAVSASLSLAAILVQGGAAWRLLPGEVVTVPEAAAIATDGANEVLPPVVPVNFIPWRSRIEAAPRRPIEPPPRVPPLTPEGVDELETLVARTLWPCAMAMQGLDFEVAVATDARGVWSTASTLRLSYQDRKCFEAALVRARAAARHRRFTPGLALTFTLHLWPRSGAG